MYKIVLPKYFALKFDRFYETLHGVDEDLASIREGGRSLDLGIKIGGFPPPLRFRILLTTIIFVQYYALTVKS